MSEALINALIALIDSRIAAATPAVLAGTPAPTPAPTPVAAPDPFGGLGGAPVQAAPVIDAKMLQELVLSMISDDAKKARMAATMAELGISELPAATPEQIPVLYQRFSAINGEMTGAPPASAPVSGGII